MIDFAQSNLVTLIAGAVIASALLGMSAWEGALREDQRVQSAVDALAFEIAAAECSAAHPVARIPLAGYLDAVRDDVSAVVLYPDHLRALRPGGGAVRSVDFPAIPLAAPLDLRDARVLELAFDPLAGRCLAAAA